jgi:DNA-binding NarL/FixJ family response regulator
MALIGMRRVLGSDIDIVGEEEAPAAIVHAAERLRPDAVVLALDRDRSRELAERVRAVAPRAKLLLWARSERLMEVLDPGASAPRQLRAAVPEGLRSELSERPEIGWEE